MEHAEKENVEFRYYEMPQGMPVLALLERNGLQSMGQIQCIFTIIWKSDIVIPEREKYILEKKVSLIGQIPL